MSMRRINLFNSLRSGNHPDTRSASSPGQKRVKASSWRSDAGAVAVYFALSAFVFIGVAGLAVDAARGYLIKARLSEAIDAAALAGGKALQTATGESKPRADALAFFRANFPTGAMGATVANPTITFNGDDTQVTVQGKATIPTTLMQILGFKTMTMGASGSVARATNGLDVVFSFDVSGSMKQPQSKLLALKSNANALVDSLAKPFTNGLQQQHLMVNGVTYSLLNIGVVPWNAKVNVKTNGQVTSGYTVTTQTVTPSFTNPVTGISPKQTKVYFASTAPSVPLLQNPSSIQGGWKGCVYARFLDDGDQTDDADITLDSVTAGTKVWPGWDPIPTYEGEDAGSKNNGCYDSYWNQNKSYPGVSNNCGTAAGQIPCWWKFVAGKGADGTSCSDCPSVGIMPLQDDTTKVKNMINTLQADGSTNTVQGLFWAWEVLTPGAPFTEAKVSPPFPRAQAIVLMTDGLIEGSNGDSYRGAFGSGPPAGTQTGHGTMTMPDGTSATNTLKNRFLALAAKIKGPSPDDPNAIKLYVIQYTQNDSTLAAMLSTAATQPNAPYYFFAPDPNSLADVFTQIAASLSALRIVQ